MRTYHPASWSQQAREMANEQFNQVIYYTYTHPEKWDECMSKEFDVKTGEYIYLTPEDVAKKFFNTSYKHKIIRERAAKRFGRLMREYKRKRGM